MISAMKATCKAATEKLGTLRLVAAMYKYVYYFFLLELLQR